MYFDVENLLLEKELFTKKFICDLNACKGACCVQGDAGAPLTIEEIDFIESDIEEIKPFMSSEGVAAVSEGGVFYMDIENEPVTTLVNNGICAFAIKDEEGIVKCSIEKAFENQKTQFIKPISCHLYPIRVKRLNDRRVLVVDNWEVCNPACSLGEQLSVPVYKFLKAPLIRAFGHDFYDGLDILEREMVNFQ
jgi:hypothetical protein